MLRDGVVRERGQGLRDLLDALRGVDADPIALLAEIAAGLGEDGVADRVLAGEEQDPGELEPIRSEIEEAGHALGVELERDLGVLLEHGEAFR